MPLVTKLKEEWKPLEKPDLKVGEHIEISNPTALIDQGMAELYVEKPTTTKEDEFPCDTCDFVAKSVAGLAVHKRSHE